MPAATKKQENTPEILRQALKEDKTRLYVFSPEEPWLQQQALRELEQAVLGEEGTDSVNFTAMDGESLTPEGLAEILDTLPVFAPRKLLEINHFRPWEIDAAKTEKLTGLLAQIPEDTVVLIRLDAQEQKARSGGGGKKGGDSFESFVKKEKSALLLTFRTPGSDEQEALLKEYFIKNGKEPAAGAVADLVSACAGNEMHAIMREAEKLISLPGNKLTRADVKAAVERSPSTAGYMITTFLFAGQGGKAVEVFRENQQRGFGEYALCSMLLNALERAYHLKLGESHHIGDATMAERLSLTDKQLWAQKRNARGVSLPRLRRAAELTGEYAADLHSSSGDTGILTEVLLLKLAVLLGGH